jgi:hypothetical protein
MGKRLTAAYCRTATADEIAMKAQERRIREYADKHGYDGETAFYRDCGLSGATLDRPALNALTADIRAGKIGTVIAADVARIARNFALASEWIDLSDKYGVALVTLAGGEIAPGGGISYRIVGDYLLPAVVLSDPPDAPPLGYYGMRHKTHLREHRPILYSRLLLSERLYPLCRAVDEAAAERLAAIGDPEIAREIVFAELVCD